MPLIQSSPNYLPAPRPQDVQYIQPTELLPDAPGFMDTLGSGLGQGLSKGIYDYMEQSALEKALGGIKPGMSLQEQMQQIVKAPKDVRQGLLTHYLPAIAEQQKASITSQRSQALGQFFKQNPKATAEDALSVGFTPKEVGGLMKARPAQQKPTATLSAAFEKQFTKRLEAVTEKEDPLKLNDFAYQKRSEYEESGLNPQQAINRALKNTEQRKDAIEELSSLAGTPPVLFPESRMKSTRKELEKFIEKGVLDIDEIVPYLQQAGWDNKEIAALVSPELTTDVLDYFLEKSRNDPKKAKEMAKEWGFKIQ